MDENQLQDICRVCRSEATPEKPLYHPCICTGSIKFIHQECLLQWLKYSRKEYCELCSHRFSFMPIYSPDMPKRLPIKDIISGLLCSLGTAIRFWLHYTLVAVAWLGIVPLTACRIYRCLFTGSLSSIITLPFDILSTFNFADNSTQIANARENILSDSLYGCCVVTCTLCAFISLVWLREQILHGGGPEWLEHEHDVVHAGDPPADAPNNNVQMNIHHQHPPIPAVALNPVQGDHPPPPSHAAVPNSNQDDCPPSPSSSSVHESHQSSNVYDNSLSSSNTNYHDHSSQNSAHQHSSLPCSNSENFSSTSDSTHHQHLHSASAENFSQQHRHSPSPPPHSTQHSPNSAHQHPSPANSVQYPLSTTSLPHQHSVPSPSSVNAAHHQHTTTNFVKHQRSSPSPPPTSVHDQLYSSNASASSIQQPSYVVPSNTPQHSPPSTPPATSVQNHYSFPSNSVHTHNSASLNIDQHQRSSSSPPSIPSHHQHAAASFANSDHHPSSTASPHAAPHQPFPPIPYFQDADDDDDSAQEDDVDANEGNNGAEDVNNWNPIEWDHAAEELTWERLLGLDGSLVFLEHVFWVVSLNTLFIVVFAFFPYHIGQFALSCFGFQEYVKAPEFEGLLTTLFGYINIGIVLALLHGVAALIRLNRTRRLFGICYVVIKVSLLSVVEIGIFPLVCGWWLDICSLTLLDATIHDREAGFKLAPGTSMFIHWLAGMVYVFYFASFILLLREVLRPGVLWFLKNLNDPDFNPIQEMIHSPILRHIRRVLISLVTFGTTILLVVWLPVRIIEKITPSFLPYQVMLANDMPYSELSLELVLLQVVMPALLEQGHMRNWLKFSVRSWCIGVSYILDIRSYLLGDVNPDDQQGDGSNVPAPAPAPAAENDGQEGFQGGALAAVHQALFQPVSPVFQPYKRPKFLPFKIVCLIILICISLTLASLVMFTVPVYIGRKVMSLWLGNTKIHELYTIGCGMYVCWMTLRISTLLWSWIPKGWASISLKLKEIFLIAVKLVCAMSMLLIVIPILMGLTLDMIVTVPIRVSLNQTPLISLWQDWAIGVLLTKTFFAIVLVSPDWWMKRVIEQVYMGGVRNINLKLIFLDLSLPIIITLGLSLSVPYIIACSIIPMFTSNFEVQNTVLRRIYPSVLGLILIVEGVIFHVRQFCRLYEHIKNDKYLVGKRLVNYEHQKLPEASQPKEEASPAS